jgi:hypothetical protein
VTDRAVAEVENALRWMATRKTAGPLELMLNAFEDPSGDSAKELGALIERVHWPPSRPMQDRALALWGLLVHLIGRVGTGVDSRRRNALMAAFRLPRRPEIAQPWARTLKARFEQLKALERVYGSPAPATTTPMHKAWNLAVRSNLAPQLASRLAELGRDDDEWARYEATARQAEGPVTGDGDSARDHGDLYRGFRPPADGAQPVFVHLFVTNVFMRGRTVYRRITERLVAAREPGVDGYMARALAGTDTNHTRVPVTPLYGCTADLVASPPGEPVMTKLRFPKALQLNELHHFSSETINEEQQDRLWVNVEVDHYGIAPGKLHLGHVPVSGLTIRIRFDDAYLPEACWSYAEQSERQRRVQPPPGDPRWLKLEGNTVCCTFMYRCQPLGHYGVSIGWPA